MVWVFDIPKSICGETVLQINVFGDIRDPNSSFLDVLAYSGHMRWLRSTGETTPDAQRDWMDGLGDFVEIFPWQTIDSTLDRDRDEINRAPFLSRRQCHRKEKAPMAPTSFYQSSKLTTVWPKAIVVEGKRTGGYPEANTEIFGEVNPVFAISSKEWMGSVPIYPETHTFISHSPQPFSIEGLIGVARDGDPLIRKDGSLQSARRSIQEFFTQKQSELVINVNKHLSGNAVLRDDLAEIHRIGAIPKYHGPTPPTDRVRGLPHNPADANLMMGKLWRYASEGKMMVCTTDGIRSETRILSPPPSTSAAKKCLIVPYPMIKD